MRSLMPHQKLAFDYVVSRYQIALYMQMRLGKTLVAIRWAEHHKSRRTLVVCPLSVIDVWMEELLKEEWAEEEIIPVLGSPKKRAKLSGSKSGQWFLINYEALLSSPGFLNEGWDCIILDESTKIRKPKPEITKLLNRKAYKIPMRALLSGHPAPESPLDYYEQMRFLFGNFLHAKNYWEFRHRFFRKAGFGWSLSKGNKQKIKEELQRSCFFLSRKEAGIGSKKIYSKRYVRLDPEQKRLIKEIEDGFEYSLDGELETTKWIPTQYGWYSTIAGGFTPTGTLISDAKYREILSLLKGELKDEPIIIWFRYNTELRFVTDRLKGKNFRVGTFTGGDKGGSKLFKEGKLQILCAQSKCGQYGLDWSRSSTAIYYSNWYDSEIRVQSEDRIVHPKKTDPLLYIDLVTKGSIDEDVVGILQEKERSSKEFSRRLIEKWEMRQGLR